MHVVYFGSWKQRDSPVSQEEHIVKEVEDFGRGLEEGHDGGVVHEVRGVHQELDDAVRGGAVEASADLIHQEEPLRIEIA